VAIKRIQLPPAGATVAHEGMVAAAEVMTVSRNRMQEIQARARQKGGIDSVGGLLKISQIALRKSEAAAEKRAAHPRRAAGRWCNQGVGWNRWVFARA
jgi:hypothetical protein